MRPFASLAVALLAVATAQSAAAQTTWHVDSTATAPGSGTVSAPYASIQYAVDQQTTVFSDTLLLAPRVYDETVDLRGKTLVVRSNGIALIARSGVGPGMIIHGAGRPSVGGVGVRLENIAFYNCADSQSIPSAGGAIEVRDSLLVMVNCRFTNCGRGMTRDALAGAIHATGSDLEMRSTTITGCGGREVGAIDLSDGSLVLDGCLIADCDANNGTRHASGVRCGDAAVELVDSTFRDNNSLYVWVGGALLSRCQATVQDCTFSGHWILGVTGSLMVEGGDLGLQNSTFTDASSYADGGHLSLRDVTAIVSQTQFVNGFSPGGVGTVFQDGGVSSLKDCLFERGNGDVCGGVEIKGGAIAGLRRCRFTENRAYHGGMPQLASALLVHANTAVAVNECVFAGNRIHTGAFIGVPNATVVGPVSLDSCTLVDNLNDAGGTVLHTATMDHGILWGNEGAAFGGASSAAWSCVEGGAPGVGNFAAEPQLGPGQELRDGSPCIDAGNAAAAREEDGSPRDVGALPWSWPSVGVQTCAGLPNSTGAVATAGAFGQPVAGIGTLYLRTTDLPPNMLMMFVVSTGTGSISLGGNGVGTLCLASPVGRFQSSAVSADATGVAAITVDPNAMPVAGGAAVAGATYWFQGWFRDLTPMGVPTSGVTAGMSVTFQ